MLLHWPLAILLGASGAVVRGDNFFDGYNYSLGPAWQWTGLRGSEANFWLNTTEEVLGDMQNRYWNGSYWPTTIQWIGAVINTIVTSTQETFGDSLQEPHSHEDKSLLKNDMQKYFAQIEAYFGSEDTIQIFGAAYDDAQWVVLEWLEVIKLMNKYQTYLGPSADSSDITKFAHRAHVFYNIVQNHFDTSTCGGGITWNPALLTYKNAITNELFISSSIGMYLHFPGDNDTDPYPSPSYISQTGKTLPALQSVTAHDVAFLNNAVQEYRWFRGQNFTNAQGLIIDGFHISAGQTSCNERNEMVYTYNQGVLLSGLRGLWEATGDTSYLTDAYGYIATVITATGWNAQNDSAANEWAGLGRNGIMEDYCDSPGNCNQDATIFKGVYFHHLSLFCEPLPEQTALIPGVTHIAPSDLAAQHRSRCASYASWVEHNAHAALSTRDATHRIGQWWGASYFGGAAIQAEMAKPVTVPQNSTDIRNEPWLLKSWPWVCADAERCGHGTNYGRSDVRPLASSHHHSDIHKRETSGGPQQTTVETQAQGLSVVVAAANFLMR